MPCVFGAEIQCWIHLVTTFPLTAAVPNLSRDLVLLISSALVDNPQALLGETSGEWPTSSQLHVTIT